LVGMISNPGKSKEMAEYAYRTVMNDYTANKMVSRTEEMYRGLVSNGTN